MRDNYPDSVPPLSRPVASLRVAGDDLIPAVVTELLGCEPTLAYARGDELPSEQGSARTAGFGLWSYAAPESTPGNLDEQVAAITAVLTADLAVSHLQRSVNELARNLRFRHYDGTDVSITDEIKCGHASRLPSDPGSVLR